MYDYIKTTKNTRRFVLPPFHIDPSGFESELKEVAKDKKEELQERLRQLKRQYKKDKELITYTKNYSEFEINFRSYQFQQEKLYIEEWLKYWNSLINPKKHFYKEGIIDEDIKKARKYPIEKLYNGELKQSGNRLVGKCPFHEEKTPSFYIFADNHYHCYGCQEHGDAIDFVMKTKNLVFLEAVKELII